MYVPPLIDGITNLTALQVAGLREDLKLKGNEYSILLSMFTAG
jgi:hypothetical protein